jgi:hypothetical protein
MQTARPGEIQFHRRAVTWLSRTTNTERTKTGVCSSEAIGECITRSVHEWIGNGTIFKQMSRPVRHVAYIGTRKTEVLFGGISPHGLPRDLI